ncbi:hypothetical protein ON010_g3797 [Phytophthora cinnamomi]|nr:hypothetical protein ON010_g3797 [Phytophthora cinnamomi]
METPSVRVLVLGDSGVFGALDHGLRRARAAAAAGAFGPRGVRGVPGRGGPPQVRAEPGGVLPRRARRRVRARPEQRQERRAPAQLEPRAGQQAAAQGLRGALHGQAARLPGAARPAQARGGQQEGPAAQEPQAKGCRARGLRGISNGGEHRCAEPLSMEPSAAFDTFLQQTVAFANRGDAGNSYGNGYSGNSGLRQTASRAVNADDGRAGSGLSAGLSSFAAALPPLSTGSGSARSRWW